VPARGACRPPGSWEPPEARQRERDLQQQERERRRDEQGEQLGVPRRVRPQPGALEIFEDRVESLVQRFTIGGEVGDAAGGAGDLLEELGVHRVARAAGDDASLTIGARWKLLL